MSLLKGFEDYLEQQGKAEETCKTYLGHVKNYMRWYQDSFGSEMDRLYRINILDYRSYLQNIEKLKAASINNKLSALSGLNEYLVERGIQEDKVIFQNDYLKIQQPFANPNDLSVGDVQALLQKILVETGKRNYAIAVLFAYAGIRNSECVNIKLKDLNLDTRELVVVGKGEKQRIVYINDKIVHAVRAYLKERDSESEYLFVSRNGGKLHRSSVNRIFNACSDEVTPHKLRHFYCSHALEDAEYTIAEVANQAGHSNVRTTLLYTNPSRKKMKEKANRL